MESKTLLITFCVVCISVQQPGICQPIDRECSTDEGTYSGKRNVTNTGKACYPWRSDNKCFKGIAEVNSTFFHNYCRNPLDPPDCHQDLPWCYTDQNGNWEFCDLPKCGSEPPENCSSPLGMGDGRIADDQIYAPTFMDQSNMAKYARLNQTNAKFWRASWSYPQYAYLSVNLRTPYLITKIHIQGATGNFVKKFKIVYSLDGYEWEYYTENKDNLNSAREFVGNHGRSDISIAYMKFPFTASKIAIIPISFSNVPSLRIELYGCPSPLNISVTEVTSINYNASWGLDRSPYIINAPTTIPPGVLLTIEAGVKVIFTQRTASLTVSGCLDLRGIKGLEVKFLTNNILSHMGLWKNPFNYDESFWNGIFINADSIGCKISSLKHIAIVGAGITTGLKSTEFNNLKISNSKSGLTLISFSGNTIVRDCLFSNNLIGIEIPTDNSLSIESSQFIENQFGVRVKNVAYYRNEIHSNLEFVETIFQDNVYGIYGEWYNDDYANITILRSNFTNHQEYGINAYRYYETQSLYSVVSSVFSSSSIRISSYSKDYSMLEFLNSTVRDLRGKAGISIESRCKNLTVSGCTFTNISGYSLKITSDITDSTIRINSSKFENNTGDGCLYFLGYHTMSIHLLRNTFLNNSVENVTNFYLPTFSDIILSKNIFKNFKSKYEISNNIIRSSNYSILASDNYWGVDDVDNISSRIFDFYRDSSKSFVEILTYFKDERFNEIVKSKNFQLWSQKNGFVGGRLDGNITLSHSPNLTVTKNILIPKGLCLDIKGPIKLDFLAGRNIFVEGGCLKAVAVTLTSSELIWNGIIFINSNGSHLSNISVSKTSIALELVNSSLEITESNFDTATFALVTGPNYNMLDVYNSDIFCSAYCIYVQDSVDMKLKITNSSLKSISINFVIGIYYIERLLFDLNETTLESKFGNPLFIGGITNGIVKIWKSTILGSNALRGGGTFMVKESNFSSDSSCLHFYEKWENIEILNNVFKCRDFAIQYSPEYYLIHSSLTIADNKFLGGELQISNRFPLKMIITNNYFNSIIRNDQSLLDLQLTRAYDQTLRIDEIMVENNVYENVVGSGVSSVIKMNCFWDWTYWTFWTGQQRNYVSAVYLRNNTFRNNNVTSTILTDCIGLTSEKNILNNPDSLYEMKVLGRTTNDFPQLMYFTRNFWGENVNDPNVRVYDETNDRTLMKVRVDPWYSDITMTRMVFRSEGFTKPSGEIGGTLTQDVVLHNKGSAYLVTEDITIPTGLKMTIEAGVKLNFVSGGMNIQGTLVAKGNETHYITFNSRDANKRWKGLKFQKPISHSLKKLEFGWWQILHNGVWKTISFFENSYDKATANILCKQAGFKESTSQAIFQCNSLSPDDKSKILPCNNISTPSVQIQCTQNNEFSLQECYIAESQMTYKFYNITCRQDVTESENYVKLQSKSGKWVSFNEKYNTLQLVHDLLNDEDGLFEQIFPCNSEESDCFTIMPLKRPGWYLRFYKGEIVLDLAINNRNPSTFLADSSFVRISKTSSEYVYIIMASQSLYLIEYNNTLSTSALEPTDTTDDAMYSFKFINLNTRSTRKKRDTGLSNDDSEFSMLQKVKIINADKGLFIRGVPPILEDIEITNTSSHGIHFRGFFDGETPLIVDGSSISNSGGNAINLDLIGDTSNLKALIGECQFENCNQGCIWWNGAGSLNISKSNFSNFRKSALYANLNVGTSSFNFTINANTFCSTIAESVVILNNEGCRGCFSVEILGNNFINSREFDNNNYNLLDHYSVNASFIGNLFDNVTYDVLLNNRYGMSFLFENNTIRNSRFGKILYLYNTASFSVSNNLFMNNTYKEYWSKLRTLTISNDNDDLRANITNNSFFNPESEYDVYVDTNWDTSFYKMLDLSLNKWILGDYSRILSKIYCFYNDASKLPVNIWPAIYVQNNSETLLPRPTSETYFFNATGGEVTFSFTIPNATSKYIFQNSILIPANITLSIEPGANIEFATGRGIVAYGVFEISSVDGEFISLSKTKKMDFYSNESANISLGNLVLESDEIKFNSTKLALSNIMFNGGTSVTIISNSVLLNNCSFNGVSDGLTWIKLHPDLQNDYQEITIQNSTFKKCERAIRLALTMNETRIFNCSFLDNNQAIVMEYGIRQNFTLIIKDCTFISNRYAVQGSISENGNIEISRCYFKDFQETRDQILDATGINLGISGANALIIIGNVFEENVQPAVNLFRAWNGRTDKQIIILQENQFRNISKTPVTMQNMYGTDVTIYRNKFESNIANRNINDKMSAIEYGFTSNLISYDWPLGNVSFAENSFLINGGKHVAKFWSSFGEIFALKAKINKFELLSNTFFNNFPSDSVIATAITANVSYNIFSNPNSKYDLIALFPPQLSENCTMNYWGSNNLSDIRRRIKDKYQDSSVGQVIYEPFLSCEEANFCSGSGSGGS